MTLLSPWSLWWLLSLPLLLCFYLFRPQPRRQGSTTTFLWKRSQPESPGGVFAQHLRSNPLLWLQLLVLLLLSLFLARPATTWTAQTPDVKRLVLAIDRSASMHAGGALEQAQEKALAGLDSLFEFSPFGSKPEVMLLAIDQEPQIVVPFSDDVRLLRAAVKALRPLPVADRLPELRPFFASLISDQKASIWLLSDHLPEALELPGLQYSACGQESSGNTALLAFSVERPRGSAATRPFLYLRAQNFSKTAEQRRLRVETLDLNQPDRVLQVVLESSILLPADGGKTIQHALPALSLSSETPTLFRARLTPLPGADALDALPWDDVAFTVAPPFGQDRWRASFMPPLQGGFMARALLATGRVEVVPWPSTSDTQAPPLDLAITPPNQPLPRALTARTRFEVTEAAPAQGEAVETLRSADHPLTASSGIEWAALRVQRSASWPVRPEETTILSTAGGPALTLHGVDRDLPTLSWRFPLAHSSLPLSPALPVLVRRFLDQYAQSADRALAGSRTTSERHPRPSGPLWQGPLQLLPPSSDPQAEPREVAPNDPWLPRLTSLGFWMVQTPTSQFWLATNLFSSSESRLQRDPQDRLIPAPGSEQETEAKAGQRLQSREWTAPLAALALLVLFWEAWLFLRRGRP